MEGGSLLNKLRAVSDGYYSETELFDVCGQIASALAYLERKSIVHRVGEAGAGFARP
jgi:serine/threonine protein kinase